jgi:lysophospholipase L1-like esterase
MGAMGLGLGLPFGRSGGGVAELPSIAGSTGFTRANNADILTAMTAFKAGTLSPKITFIGDSTKAGFGATAVDGWAGSRVLAPSVMAGVALELDGIPCTNESLWGRSGSSTFFTTYIAPQTVTLGAGWNVGSFETVGGVNIADCAGVTSTTTFVFAEAGDMLEVSVFSIASSVTYEVSFDNIAWQSSGAGPINQGTARTTFTSGTGPSSTVYIRRASGTSLFLVGVSLFSSTTRKLRLENMGRGSATTLTWTDTTNAYSAGNEYYQQGAHLVIINLTTNDHATISDPTAPMSRLATMIANCKAQGASVWVEVPHPSDNCTTTVLDDYQAAIIGQAASSGATCIDLMSEYNRNAGWSGAGYGYYAADGVHPNAAGYNYIGLREKALIKALYDAA